MTNIFYITCVAVLGGEECFNAFKSIRNFLSVMKSSAYNCEQVEKLK